MLWYSYRNHTLCRVTWVAAVVCWPYALPPLAAIATGAMILPVLARHGMLSGVGVVTSETRKFSGHP